MKFGVIVSQVILTAFLSLILVKANAATLEENFASDMQDEYQLSDDDHEEIVNTLKDLKKKRRQRILFCTQRGASAMIEALNMNCRNLHGQHFLISFIGVGASLGAQAGFAMMIPEVGSRLIKAGTYRFIPLEGAHLGLGFNALHLTNDNASIDYSSVGLTLGLGISISNGIVTVKDLSKKAVN